MRTVRLSEVTKELESGGRPGGGASDTVPGVLSIGGEHLQADGSFILENRRHIPQGYFESMRRGRIEPEDILIVKDGATTGKVAFVDSKLPLPAAVNEHVFRLSVERTKAVPRYVFYHLLSPTGNRQILQDFRGATVGGISRDFPKHVEFPLPNLATQQRIAGLLELADRLRRTHRYALELSDAVLPAVFLELFGDKASASQRFPLKHLGEVVQPNRGVTYGIVQAGPEVPDGVPYIRTGDIVDGEIRTSRLSRTSKEIAAAYRRSEVKWGDLVFSIRATVGTVALLPPQLDGANLTQGTARVAPGPGINKQFLLWQMRMPEAQRWIMQQVKGTTFSEITLAKLRALPVFVPPLPLQRKFALIVQEHERLLAEQREALRQAEHLFQSLLHRAFSV